MDQGRNERHAVTGNSLLHLDQLLACAAVSGVSQKNAYRKQRAGSPPALMHSGDSPRDQAANRCRAVDRVSRTGRCQTPSPFLNGSSSIKNASRAAAPAWVVGMVF